LRQSTAKLELDAATRLPAVRPLQWNNSGHLAGLVGAQALFCVPANTKELPAGSRVDTLFIYRG